jgi:hypothetical protein
MRPERLRCGYGIDPKVAFSRARSECSVRQAAGQITGQTINRFAEFGSAKASGRARIGLYDAFTITKRKAR